MAEIKNGISPYTELSPREYVGLIEAINQNHTDEVRRDVERFPQIGEPICIVVAGSDGKLERHSQSPTELVLIQDSTEQSQLDREFVDWYNDSHSHHISKAYLGRNAHGDPELKRIGSEALLSYAFDDPKLVYPDRVLNTQFIIGDRAVHEKAKRQVLEEMTADTASGKRIREVLSDQLRQYKKALDIGQYRKKTIFTTEPPIQYYNEDPDDYRVGFKISALRTVQRTLDIMTLRAIRSGKITIDQAAGFSANSLERIDALRELEIFQNGEREINEAYSWFLQRYHHAQEMYKNSRALVALPYDTENFLRYRDIILDFADKTQKVGTFDKK